MTEVARNIQIPSDLVVKSQLIDIIDVILQLIKRPNGVQMACRNRKSRCELLSTSEVQWSTTKSDGVCQFLQQLIEGDELYTRVKKNVAPDESQGWTIVLMDRATRFLWDMQCGRKDRKLFKNAMHLLCDVIQQTGDLTLLTDGERRYGSLLFELCSQALRNGKRGRPKKTLPKGVKVRLKNKGSQRHKRGPKRPKYQAPSPEHPDTAQPIVTQEMHAHHLAAFHTFLRRRWAAYRRRTNRYAKTTGRLQARLDVYWSVHHVVRVHFTTRQVPAVA